MVLGSSAQSGTGLLTARSPLAFVLREKQVASCLLTSSETLDLALPFHPTSVGEKEIGRSTPETTEPFEPNTFALTEQHQSIHFPKVLAAAVASVSTPEVNRLIENRISIIRVLLYYHLV